jgi:hypothetical protein
MQVDVDQVLEYAPMLFDASMDIANLMIPRHYPLYLISLCIPIGIE